MDWMFDETYDDKRRWVLTVIDARSRMCPVMRVCRSATAMAVSDALDGTCRTHGYPGAIRIDQGSQFTSKKLDLWAYTNGVTLDFNHPGEATDTDVVEMPFLRSATFSSQMESSLASAGSATVM